MVRQLARQGHDLYEYGYAASGIQKHYFPKKAVDQKLKINLVWPNCFQSDSRRGSGSHHHHGLAKDEIPSKEIRLTLKNVSVGSLRYYDLAENLLFNVQCHAAPQ